MCHMSIRESGNLEATAVSTLYLFAALLRQLPPQIHAGGFGHPSQCRTDRQRQSSPEREKIPSLILCGCHVPTERFPLVCPTLADRRPEATSTLCVSLLVVSSAASL